MLSRLSIKNLAIVESLEINFHAGFNVITGETGAGKSILIKSLQMLLGAKASLDLIRAGCEQATVIGAFQFAPDHKIMSLIEKLGLPVEDDFSFIIRRSINQKSKSLAWFNDVAIAVSTLKEIGDAMVDIMNQFENHRLLNPSEHLVILDRFVKDAQLPAMVANAFEDCQITIAKIKDKAEQLAQSFKNRDYLEFRVAELAEFKPSASDFDHVKTFVEQEDTRQKNFESLSLAQNVLDESYNGSSLKRAFKDIEKHLYALKDQAQIFQLTARIAVDVDQLSYEISNAASKFDLDRSEVQELSSRLDQYYNLFRKLAVHDAAALEEEFARIQKDLDAVLNSSLEFKYLFDLLETYLLQLDRFAAKLTQDRKLAAQILAKRVNKELKELAMPGAELKVVFELPHEEKHDFFLGHIDHHEQVRFQNQVNRLGKFSARGAERIQFFLRSNTGDSFHKLNKIASGGEASRIMLALKRALVEGAETCVLVFDEIDTGISGRVADVVGRKLKQLSTKFQIVCISHLPQVAAFADQHLRVQKKSSKLKTESTIVTLSHEESLEELARLLSGTKITKQSIDNARNLKSSAGEKVR